MRFVGCPGSKGGLVWYFLTYNLVYSLEDKQKVALSKMLQNQIKGSYTKLNKVKWEAYMQTFSEPLWKVSEGDINIAFPKLPELPTESLSTGKFMGLAL